MIMMTPQRQLVNPFFTGGNQISVSYPADTMTYEQREMSMRGNNIPFAHATAFHEMIPGHFLQFYLAARYHTYRKAFSTPFWHEGDAFQWEMEFYDRGFDKTPEGAGWGFVLEDASFGEGHVHGAFPPRRVDAEAACRLPDRRCWARARQCDGGGSAVVRWFGWPSVSVCLSDGRVADSGVAQGTGG
jgi:hypothetical protein